MQIVDSTTGYTLPANRFEIGTFKFLFSVPYLGNPFNNEQAKHWYAEYGITDHLQIGTRPIANLLGRLNVHMALSSPVSPQYMLTSAVPVEVTVPLGSKPASAETGLLLSWAPYAHSALHVGFRIVAPVNGPIALSKTYTAFNIPLFANVQLVGEFNYFPGRLPARNPFTFRIGSLAEWNAFHLRVFTDLPHRFLISNLSVLEIHVELFLRM